MDSEDENKNYNITDIDKKSTSGQMTVFVALILTVIISLILVVFDSVRIQCMYMNQKQALMIACENLLAQYCIPLYERYDLFGIDGNGRDLTKALEVSIRENSGGGLFEGKLENAVISQLYPLVDDSNQLFEKEIINYMKTAGLIDIAAEQLKLWTNMENSNVEEEKTSIVHQLQTSQNQADQTMNQKDGQQNVNTNVNQDSKENSTDVNKAEVSDPRKSVNQLLKKGVLSLVLPKDMVISEQSVHINLQTEGKAKTLTDFTDSKSITEKMNEVEFSVGNMQNMPLEKCVILLYLQQHFKNAVNQDVQQSRNTALDYEMEALLCGHSSDIDNLSDTVNRMIIFRMVLNLSYLLTNSVKSKEAHAVSAALSAVIALPVLEQLFYLMIVLAWSYAEAIVDVRALFNGEKIDLIKTDMTWQLSIENLMNISEASLEHQQKATSLGIDYEGYLFLLMMFTNQNKIENRAIALMQENIRLEQGYEAFNMNDCYYGLTCIAGFSCQGFYGHFEHQVQWSECY